MSCPYRDVCHRYDPEFCNNWAYEGCEQYMLFDLVNRAYRDAPSDNTAIVRILSGIIRMHYQLAVILVDKQSKRYYRRTLEKPRLQYRVSTELIHFIKNYMEGT